MTTLGKIARSPQHPLVVPAWPLRPFAKLADVWPKLWRLRRRRHPHDRTEHICREAEAASVGGDDD